MKKITLFLIVLILGNWLYGQSLSRRSADDGWQLFYGPYDTTSPSNPDELMKLNWPFVHTIVPGNVEIDLQAAGIIENPETGNNI